MADIYVIGTINEDLYTEFSKELNQVVNDSRMAPPLIIEFSSGGGDEEAALSMYGRLMHIKASITALNIRGRAHGQVYSAAVLPYAACDIRWCTPETMFLIHNSKDKVTGDYRKVRQYADLLERREQNWAELLAKHTKTPAAKWRELSDAESYLSAKEALELGLVHKIIGE